MTADLFEQHRQIVTLMEELILLVRQEPPPNIEDIAQLRARLGMAGIIHLQAEDELVMAPLLASGRSDEIPEAAAIIEEIRASRRYSADHASRWPMDAVAANLAGYADALDRMLDVVRAITEREEAGLYRQVISLLNTGPARRVH